MGSGPGARDWWCRAGGMMGRASLCPVRLQATQSLPRVAQQRGLCSAPVSGRGPHSQRFLSCPHHVHTWAAE